MIRVGLTSSFGDDRTQRRFGLGALADSDAVTLRLLEPAKVLDPSQLRDLDAVVMLRAEVTEQSLEEAHDLVLLARWGVGVDEIDVDACTRRGVAVTIAPEGTRRAVASSAVALILASAHRIRRKDLLLRAGDWAKAPGHTGVGLAGRTLGSIGLGRIAREMFRLIAPFGMRHIAFDPYVGREMTGQVDLVGLDELAQTSDVVCVCAALTPETHHLLGEGFFSLLKDGAIFVNVARGAIVNESALVAALESGKVASAALDVFESEPIDLDSPLLRFDDVILTPHSVAWTDELYSGNGADVTRAILAVAAGRAPDHLVDPKVVGDPGFQSRLESLVRRHENDGSDTARGPSGGGRT